MTKNLEIIKKMNQSSVNLEELISRVIPDQNFMATLLNSRKTVKDKIMDYFQRGSKIGSGVTVVGVHGWFPTRLLQRGITGFINDSF
jgi:hypothetical protein